MAKLQEKLNQCQRANSRKSQKTRNRNAYRIDRKIKMGESRDGVQKPQAKKTAGGIDAEFPTPADGHSDDAQQHQNQKGGDNQCCKFFHRNLRITVIGMHIIALDNGISVPPRL